MNVVDAVDMDGNLVDGDVLRTRRHPRKRAVKEGYVQDPLITSTALLASEEVQGTSVAITNNIRAHSPNPSETPAIVSSGTNDLSTSKALILVVIVFASSLLALGFLYSQFPDLEEQERVRIKIPRNLEDAKHLGLVLERYKEKYFFEVLSGVFLIYIFLQTFAIPGSIFLSILSGFLFPFYLALVLVCCCSAVGASLCFFISNLVGKKLVKKFFPERAAQWAKTVTKHQHNMLSYIIFLRVTPFLPNWFINMTAPVVGVPLVPFALGTFIGVAPPSFVAIQAGQTLHTLTSTSDAWSLTSIVVLTLCATLSLAPVLFKKQLRFL